MLGNENASTKARLLEILRQTDKRVSGEELSSALEISRTSVWKAVQGLQKAGYQIDAQKSGYLLKEKSHLKLSLILLIKSRISEAKSIASSL